VDSVDPRSEYATRLNGWKQRWQQHQKTFIRLGNARLALAIIAAVMAWAAYAAGIFSGWWLLAPLAVFIAIVVSHEGVAHRQQFAQRGIVYYERALARLSGKWAGAGSPGDRFKDPGHVYSDDLDIFGGGSLFELLSTARTAAGEQTLADWLRTPAAPEQVRARQAAVAELRSRVQMREDLALLGEDVQAALHAQAVSRWGSQPPVPLLPGARWLALFAAAGSIVTFICFMAHWLGFRPFGIMVLADLAVGALLRRPVMRIIAAVDTPAHDLRIFALLLARLEQERFETPLLNSLQSRFETAGAPASRRIGRLERWMEILDSSDHLVVRMIGIFLLWREQAALAIEAWRRKTGPRIGAWIEAVAELEALASLATFAFERPSATFPELRDQGPMIEADALEHPLLDPRVSIPNDLRLGGNRRLLIVSGSNMSGKSTLLRAAGLNLVLAWAGAPVTAARLLTSPLAVGASIRVLDSLQEGRSRFYAEITRLRQIVSLASGDRPALFLLDELLSGTNSHDRRIGAEAVVHGLLERGAVGLITTHDLALTGIAETLDGTAVNVHFDDHIENGRISFDYKLKPGVVEHSNALELMRAVGLDV
jgi:MutS domain V